MYYLGQSLWTVQWV